MARKKTKRPVRKAGARKTASTTGRRTAPRAMAAKRRNGRQVPLRAMSELTDQQKLRAFAAVQQTLRAHGVGNTVAEIHFASDEMALVCGPGQVRRMVAFMCGPGVCTKNVCVPITS